MSGRTFPALSRVVPLNSSEVKVKAMLSVRYKARRVWKSAPPNPAWPDGYDGNGGVKFGPVRLLAGAPSGEKLGSPMGAGFPSPAPVAPLRGSDSRMPVTGRRY